MPVQKLVNVFCGAHCASGACEFQAEVENGKIEHIEVHPKMKLPPCAKGRTGAFYYHPEALQYPLKRQGQRGEGKWQRISWDEALETVARELNAAKIKYGNESVALYIHAEGKWEMPSGPLLPLKRLFNLWGGCLELFSKNNTGIAGSASHARKQIYGSPEIVLPYDNECKLIIIWAKNPAETAFKVDMKIYIEAKEKGTKFVVIDPVFTSTAAVLADEYVAIHPGTDGVLALAMTNVIIEEGLYDRDFVTKYTNAPFLVKKDNGLLLRESHIVAGGLEDYLVWDPVFDRPQNFRKLEGRPPLTGSYTWEGLEIQPVWELISNMVKEWTPERAANITGVPAETIVRLGKEFGKARPARVEGPHGASVGFQTWSENTSNAIELLNIITGNIKGTLNIIDQPAPGLNIGLMTIARKLFEGSNPVLTPFSVNQFAEAVMNPSKYNTNIRFLFCMFGNPVAQIGNSNKTIRALMQLDFIVVASVFMTATAKYADIVLPSSLFWARDSIYEGSSIGGTRRYSAFHYLKPPKQLYFSQKAVEPLGESKDDFDIVCLLARKMGYAEHFPWRNAEEYIEDLINKAKQDPAFPWLKSLTMAQLRKEGIVDIDAPPPPIPTMKFPTPSGRIELYSEGLLKKGWDPMPIYREPEEGPVRTPDLYRKYPLNLITCHPLLRNHSYFENQPELLEQYTHDVLINPFDASRRGIKDGDPVVVFNDRGSIELKATVAEAIMPGVVRIYHCGWPEPVMENLLTSDRYTGYAQAPAYNTCLVEVKKSNKQAA